MEHVLIITMLLGINGQNYIEPTKVQEPKEKLLEKIEFENFEISPMSLSEEIGSTNTDKVEIKVLCDYEEFHYDMIDNEKTIEEQREELFAQGKAHHSQHNQQIINQLDTSEMDNLYVSSYSPYFTYESTIDEISANDYEQLYELASCSYVEKIYVSPEHEYQSMLEDATEAIGVYDYIETGDLTGEGVVVGVLETGIVDKDHNNFKNIDLTVRNEWYYIETVTAHATQVASIIAKMAPDAKILSVELSGNAVSEVDWMLDRNVNVINLSYGEKNPTGKYNSDSAYMDYIANTYRVTIVAAVGNNGDSTGYVSNPALGYNVIGVGSCASFNSSALYWSSYKEDSTLPNKPNVVAPGYAIEVEPFGVFEGTSYSAPIVSACVALLMEVRADLKLHPEYVLALMMNNAEGNDEEIGVDNYIGSGRINFEEMMNYITEIIPIFNNSETVYTIRTYNVILRRNQVIKASAAWLSKANGKADGTSSTDYDIQLLYYSNGEYYVMTHSVQSYDPYETFTFALPDDCAEGVYLLRFKQASDAVQEDHAALCYKIYDAN